MRTLALIFLLPAVALTSSCSKKAEFTPPPADRIAALFEFSGPVQLACEIAGPEELKKGAELKVGPVASFEYADPTKTYHSITVAVFATGTFLGDKRKEMIDRAATLSTKTDSEQTKMGAFSTTDGRTGYQFPLGFGAGGGAYVALLPCRDARYELVVLHSSIFDENDPAKQASPRKDAQAVIEEIERLVFP